MGEVFYAIRKFLLLIDFPEKSRIVEAGFQNSFVALLHQTIGVGGNIHHGNKMRRQHARTGFDGEVLLVMAHHHGKDLGWEF